MRTSKRVCAGAGTCAAHCARPPPDPSTAHSSRTCTACTRLVALNLLVHPLSESDEHAIGGSPPNIACLRRIYEDSRIESGPCQPRMPPAVPCKPHRGPLALWFPSCAHIACTAPMWQTRRPLRRSALHRPAFEAVRGPHAHPLILSCPPAAPALPRAQPRRRARARAAGARRAAGSGLGASAAPRGGTRAAAPPAPNPGHAPRHRLHGQDLSRTCPEAAASHGELMCCWWARVLADAPQAERRSSAGSQTPGARPACPACEVLAWPSVVDRAGWVGLLEVPM